MAANTLTYSDSALGVKAAFYNKKAMVYVEGTDDIIFWEQFFDKLVYKVEDVGGCGNFNAYIQRLNNGEKSFVVAGDLDYSPYMPIRILGDSCYRFLDQSNLPEINPILVDNFYNAKVVHFNAQEIKNVKKLIQSEQRPKRLLVKGHFLTEAIRLWINKRVPSVSTKNPQLNGDALYEALVTCHDICTPICKERAHILRQIEEVEKNIEFTII